MSLPPDERHEEDERILLLIPEGRNAQVTRSVLAEAGLRAEACQDVEELRDRLAEGGAVLLLGEEALGPRALEALEETLRAQPSWSEVPIVLVVGRGSNVLDRLRAMRRLQSGGNVTLVERPVYPLTLISVVEASLRARRRQYQTRELLQRLRATTEELVAEKAQRERFVSVLAHDLRGPLTAASLAVQRLLLLARKGQASGSGSIPERIARNLERADRMVRELLDANRLESGRRMPLHLGPCDLEKLAAEMLGGLEAGVERVRVEVEEGPIRGIWSTDQLQRVLWNLVTNALKYGAAGTPVRITLRAAGEVAELSVHNEGPAIPEQEQATLFEPYQRAGTSRGSEGWGLGLAFVRGCAEAHGGSVSVESQAEGTTFTLRLPWDARPFQPGSSGGEDTGLAR